MFELFMHQWHVLKTLGKCSTKQIIYINFFLSLLSTCKTFCFPLYAQNDWGKLHYYAYIDDFASFYLYSTKGITHSVFIIPIVVSSTKPAPALTGQ